MMQKRGYRLVEILVLSTWTMTFFVGFKPELIRAISVIVGMVVTIPKLYSGLVRRESPENYPKLDSVVRNYAVVNIKASARDLNCLSYPYGVEAIADPLESIVLLNECDYTSELVTKGKHLLVIGGSMSQYPTIYIGMEAYQIAKANFKTSIPCLLVLPDSDRQIPLNVG